MEMTLVIVTLISLALAIAMGVMTWRLLQEERLRADARVEALEQGLAESLRTDPPIRVTPPARAVTPEPSVAPDTLAVDDLGRDDNTDWLSQFAPAGAPPHAPVPDLPAPPTASDPAPALVAAADISISRDNDTPLSGRSLFAPSSDTPGDRPAVPRRLVAIAAVAAVVIGAVLAFWTIGRLTAPAVGAPGSAAQAPAPAAIELVSLRHAQQQDGTLTITGLVRNPHAGILQERLTAVVFFFDGQGGFLSSTRAPLDFRALAPGDESPFQLSAPAPPGVARFRVSFRRDEGAIVPHVDRRQQEASRS